MKKAITTTAILIIALTVQSTAAQQPSPTPAQVPPGSTAVRIVPFSHFVVSLIDDTKVSAQEEGVLISLDAKEGMHVKKDDLLAKIDDSDAQIRRMLADNELKIATEKAQSDANVEAAKATVEVARGEYDESQDMVKRSAKSISEFEMRRKRLTLERSIHESANAQVEHKVNQLTMTMREAQLKAVDREIERRTVLSPIDGVVVRRFRHQGDWVKPGEPIYQVVRMDLLRVEGLMSADRFTPAQVEGHRVDIQIEIPNGADSSKKEVITLEKLKVDFASPVVDSSNDFLVFVEFQNPKDRNGRWVIRPGLEANIKMYFPLAPKQPTVAKQ